MLRDEGHRVELYDPFYAPDPAPLEDRPRYDFITATEVVEHLHAPGVELRRLWRLLRPAGMLVLMTQLLPASDEFPTWHYISDPTHVCFFGARSIEWLGETLSTEPELLPAGVVFFRRGDENS
jgi:SAM-dependent methyltransferase